MLRNSSRSTVPIMNGRAAGLPAAPGCINMALCERYAPAVAAAAADVTGAGPAAATTEPNVGVHWPRRCRRDSRLPPRRCVGLGFRVWGLGSVLRWVVGRCSLGSVPAHRLITRFCFFCF